MFLFRLFFGRENAQRVDQALADAGKAAADARQAAADAKIAAAKAKAAIGRNPVGFLLGALGVLLITSFALGQETGPARSNARGGNRRNPHRP